MIIRCRVEGGQAREILWRELTHMGTKPQFSLAGCFENALGLSDVESAALAKDIHEISQMLLCRFGNHFLAHQINIGIGLLLEIRGNYVRTKQCGYHGASPLLGCSPDSTK